MTIKGFKKKRDSLRLRTARGQSRNVEEERTPLLDPGLRENEITLSSASQRNRKSALLSSHDLELVRFHL